jgi:hypothetical protein
MDVVYKAKISWNDCEDGEYRHSNPFSDAIRAVDWIMENIRDVVTDDKNSVDGNSVFWELFAQEVNGSRTVRLGKRCVNVTRIPHESIVDYLRENEFVGYR